MTHHMKSSSPLIQKGAPSKYPIVFRATRVHNRPAEVGEPISATNVPQSTGHLEPAQISRGTRISKLAVLLYPTIMSEYYDEPKDHHANPGTSISGKIKKKKPRKSMRTAGTSKKNKKKIGKSVGLLKRFVKWVKP